MIVSDSWRFICFQPWKCASTTLYKRLGRYDSGRYPQGRRYNATVGGRLTRHLDLATFVQLPESEADYYRFSFVRNPYDRLYSGYNQRKFRFNGSRRKIPDSASTRAERHAVMAGFVPFLEFCAEQHAATGRVLGGFLHEYVLHDDEPMLDFVGFTETFEASLAEVCRTIGIQPRRRNANVRRRPRRDGAEAHRYLSCYDAESLGIVNDLYEKDFEVLGYQMVAPAQLDETTPPRVFDPTARDRTIVRAHQTD